MISRNSVEHLRAAIFIKDLKAKSDYEAIRKEVSGIAAASPEVHVCQRQRGVCAVYLGDEKRRRHVSVGQLAPGAGPG